MQHVFVQNGELTPDGVKLLNWLEAQVSGETNADKLNAMSGFVKEYFAITRAKSLTPQGWLETFRSSAENAFDTMSFIEGKAQEEADRDAKLAENTEATSKIEAQLRQLKEDMQAELDALKAENVALKAKLEPGEPKKKAAKKTEDAPVEAETPEA
jgi:hypothetical protein